MRGNIEEILPDTTHKQSSEPAAEADVTGDSDPRGIPVSRQTDPLLTLLTDAIDTSPLEREKDGLTRDEEESNEEELPYDPGNSDEKSDPTSAQAPDQATDI